MGRSAQPGLSRLSATEGGRVPQPRDGRGHPATPRGRRRDPPGGPDVAQRDFPVRPSSAGGFALPQTPLELRRTFIRGRSDLVSTIGTTWLDAEVCLGSVNRSAFWTQRRPLIGYWKTAADPAVVFRLRFLHDDRDFASMGGVTAQRGPRALTVFTVWPNQGDWHPQLDRPKEGLFEAADFRVRYELTGRGVAADPLGEGRCRLCAGDYRAVIHTVPSLFDDRKVVWQISHSENRVFLDGICYHGIKRNFDFRKLGAVAIAVGVEILRVGQSPAKYWPQLTASRPGLVEAVWDVGEKLHVHAP